MSTDPFQRFVLDEIGPYFEYVCAECGHGIFRPIGDEDSKPPLERQWQCARCAFVGVAVERLVA